jgi:hypothetical protein
MTRSAFVVVAVALTGCLQPASDVDAGRPEVKTLPDGGTATWHRDALKVSRAHCEGCHVAGGIAPFSMETYDAVKNRAPQIANAVKERRMPPWMPNEACGMSYRDERKLTQAEIDVFTAWAAGGAVEGDPKDAPPKVTQQALDWVDTALVPPVAYTPSATLVDDYHCFLLDPKLTTGQSVIGYEVKPGVRNEVHHVLLYAVDAAEAKAADDKEAGEGWTCFGASGIGQAELIGGWVPGSGAVRYPSGTGISIAAGKVLAMQIHYNTSVAVRQPDATTIELQFARTGVTPAVLIPLLDPSFSIPPNAMGYTPSNHPRPFPNDTIVDLKLWGVLPHMHQKGKRIMVNGPKGCLIDIPQWDFHWQQQYFFKAPMVAKRGEKAELTCTWDNPTSKSVTWGEGTDDEMCLAYLYATVN